MFHTHVYDVTKRNSSDLPDMMSPAAVNFAPPKTSGTQNIELGGSLLSSMWPVV